MRATVDVGLTTGVALWKGKIGEKTFPDSTFVIAAPRKGSIIERAGHVSQTMAKAAEIYRITLAVLEEPQYMDSASGQRSARRGDLFKLVFCAGMTAGALREVGVVVRLLKIGTWKGQLPKKIVDERIARALKISVPRLNQLYVTSHERDAVGMGLAFAGRLHLGES
jgi:hypothetical protein